MATFLYLGDNLLFSYLSFSFESTGDLDLGNDFRCDFDCYLDFDYAFFDFMKFIIELLEELCYDLIDEDFEADFSFYLPLESGFFFSYSRYFSYYYSY